MAPHATQLLQQRLVIINGFYIDAAISEKHNFPSEVTDFPTESGSTLADNIRIKPFEYEIDAIVSNSPIGQLVDLRDTTGNGDPNEPVDKFYDMMLKIRTDREPVTISTSLRTYENMACEDFDFPRDKDVGDAIKFSAKFKQISTVQNKRSIRVAPDAPSAMNGKGGKAINGTPKAWVFGDGHFFKVQTRSGISAKIGTWWDDDIGGWRNGGLFDGNLAQWRLFKGRPLGISIVKWQAKPLEDEEIEALRKSGGLTKEASPDPKTVQLVAGHVVANAVFFKPKKFALFNQDYLF